MKAPSPRTEYQLPLARIDQKETWQWRRERKIERLDSPESLEFDEGISFDYRARELSNRAIGTGPKSTVS